MCTPLCGHLFSFILNKDLILWAGEVARCLRLFATLVKDPNLVLRTHIKWKTKHVTTVPGDHMTSNGLCRHYTHMNAYTHTHLKNICIREPPHWHGIDELVQSDF